MDCPFCGKEMRAGKIPSRDHLKWYDSAGGEDAWTDGVRLSESFQEAQAFFCPDCRRIVMPVPEVEDFLDKIQRKIDVFSEKMEARQKEREAQRTQAKIQKEREKFGSKDPWEL